VIKIEQRGHARSPYFLFEGAVWSQELGEFFIQLVDARIIPARQSKQKQIV
jgi:hypothetical protein